jgi:single-strand DNA-binding protein
METSQYIGTVGSDPDVRFTPANKKVVSFSIAINKTWYNQAGEKQQKTKWVKCVAWEKTADTLEKYVHKGDRIFVSGEMDVNTWTDKSSGEAKGQLQLTIREFEFLGGKREQPQEETIDYSQVDFGDVPSKQDDSPF